MTQVPAAAIAGLNDVAQGNGLTGSFGTDRPTEKTVVMKDADFGHIPWIIANDDRFAHVGGQGEIEVAQALEMHPILAHLATFGYRQQQQIELFKTFREPGEKTAAFPSGLRRLIRFTMGTLMILVQNKVLKLSFKG